MATLTHPDLPYVFTAPFDEGDTLTDEAATALNTLKLDQAMLEAKARKIPDIELEEFIGYQLRKAPINAPALTRNRTAQQKAARKILVARIKDAYREKSLTITGNLAAIEGLANRIETEAGAQWQTCMDIAAAEEAAPTPTAADAALSL